MPAFLSPVGGLYLAVGAFAVYAIYAIVYKLYLSPLADVPGPKIAALTRWYEIYYDLIDGPRFPWVVEKLHQKYGIGHASIFVFVGC